MHSPQVVVPAGTRRPGAFVILPAFRQPVQTCTRFVVPPTTARTRWMLGFHRRLVRRWECDTDMPHEGFLPQISHTEAITHRHRLPTRTTEQWYEVSEQGVRSLQ